MPEVNSPEIRAKAESDVKANFEPPFSRFKGRLKQLHVAELDDVFDHFFPRFRDEVTLSSFVTRGRGRAFFGGLVGAGDSAVFVGRGRERRFSGDANAAQEAVLLRRGCLNQRSSEQHIAL
ncbi:MAG TPA: hypothetical protein VKG78_07565 [Opitutaceae bacterium]|nr:hypothetical protein [Opitutaceae bacterium]